jgi:hypothetical protein
MINIALEVGDRVHARLYTPDRSDVATQDFNITAIEGTTYFGGPIPCNTEDGWELELTIKSMDNLALPETLAEITAYDLIGEKHHLMGKGLVWSTSVGEPFDCYRIVSWEPGHI